MNAKDINNTSFIMTISPFPHFVNVFPMCFTITWPYPSGILSHWPLPVLLSEGTVLRERASHSWLLA